VHTDGESAGARRMIVPRQIALAFFVERSVVEEGKRVCRDYQSLE
jgi:hypothetical protein